MLISFCHKEKDLKIGATFAENQDGGIGNARFQICEQAERLTWIMTQFRQLTVEMEKGMKNLDG